VQDKPERFFDTREELSKWQSGNVHAANGGLVTSTVQQRAVSRCGTETVGSRSTSELRLAHHANRTTAETREPIGHISEIPRHNTRGVETMDQKTKKSQGHLGFCPTTDGSQVEFFRVGSGIYRAPIDSKFGVDGRRTESVFECDQELWERYPVDMSRPYNTCGY
jgi:hypothetical protein